MHWCTAACGAAAAAGAGDGEEEGVIRHKTKVQNVYFCTGVLLFSLIDHR